jgi:hypothetical protein
MEEWVEESFGTQEDDDNQEYLERLGINTRPQNRVTIAPDNPIWSQVTDLGTIGLAHTVGSDLNIPGTFTYRGQDLDSYISRIVEARLAVYTESIDRYIEQFVLPEVETRITARIQQRREEE